MKSDLFEALETLRAWYLDDQVQRKQEMDRMEQDAISEALKDGGGVPGEEWALLPDRVSELRNK